MSPNADARAGRAAFSHPGFVLFQIARFLIVSAVEMQAVAVGWQVYEITKRPLDLGYVGLAQFLPGILLFPISGHTSDRFERRNVLSACYAGYAVCFALLLALSRRGVTSIAPIYVVLVMIGVVRSFNGTASRSILPQLVPEEHFANGVAWNATIFQAATILGPSFGGIVYAAFHGPSAVYVIAMVTAIGATLSSLRIKPEIKARPRLDFRLDPQRRDGCSNCGHQRDDINRRWPTKRRINDSTERRSQNRRCLEDTGVPGDCVREVLLRYELRQDRSACGAVERTNHTDQNQDDINRGDRRRASFCQRQQQREAY